MEKHDAAKTLASYVGFTMGDDDPQCSYRTKFHKLDEGENLLLKNTQAAD